MLDVEDVAEDYVNCTMCGACELRCPNTLITGDFYRFRQRTIDVVKAMRALAVSRGDPPEELEAVGRAGRSVGQRAGARLDAQTSGWSKVRAWAAGLEIPTGGETILFADCEAAF